MIGFCTCVFSVLYRIGWLLLHTWVALQKLEPSRTIDDKLF